jgi:hypothetical protein
MQLYKWKVACNNRLGTSLVFISNPERRQLIASLNNPLSNQHEARRQRWKQQFLR